MATVVLFAARVASSTVPVWGVAVVRSWIRVFLRAGVCVRVRVVRNCSVGEWRGG